MRANITDVGAYVAGDPGGPPGFQRELRVGTATLAEEGWPVTVPYVVCRYRTSETGTLYLTADAYKALRKIRAVVALAHAFDLRGPPLDWHAQELSEWSATRSAMCAFAHMAHVLGADGVSMVVTASAPGALAAALVDAGALPADTLLPPVTTPA